MKKVKLIGLLIILSQSLFSQSAGNVNYQNQVRFQENNINVRFNASNEILISVKGLNNVKADAYVAIFSITQTGKNTEEVDQLLDQRIQLLTNNLSTHPEVKLFIDMISFVPLYEYEVDKKVFSRRNYNEIPVGFELKKNLHIQYQKPEFLNDLISMCSKSEIYDLVRVDYVSENMQDRKKELIQQAETILAEKLNRYGAILNMNLDTLEKEMTEGFRVLYPVEMYKSYQAYSSSSLSVKKSAKVRTKDKATTQYFQPIVDKEFDFVIQPTIVEPVIQVLYELKVKVRRKPATQIRTKKEYMLVTPNGEVKNLRIEN